MKKLITTIAILIGITIPTYAAETIDSKDYIKEVNINMAQLGANTSNEDKATISTILLNGINEGYINPSMNNEMRLRDSLVDMYENIKDYNVSNTELNKKHTYLISNMKDLISLLNERIECKGKTLDSENRLMKVKYILVDDNENVNMIDEKIDNINEIYKEIAKFDKKFNSRKYA